MIEEVKKDIKAYGVIAAKLKAEELIYAGDYKEAKTFLLAFLDKQDSSPEIYRLLAINAFQSGDFDSAKIFISKARDLSPDDKGCIQTEKAIFASIESPKINMLRRQVPKLLVISPLVVFLLCFLLFINTQGSKSQGSISQIKDTNSEIKRTTSSLPLIDGAESLSDSAGTIITFKAGLFSSGIQFSSKTAATIKSICENLPQHYFGIVIYGSTDNIQPESEFAYKTNADLGLARAMAIYKFMTEQCNIKPEKISMSRITDCEAESRNTNLAERLRNRTAIIRIIF